MPVSAADFIMPAGLAVLQCRPSSWYPFVYCLGCKQNMCMPSTPAQRNVYAKGDGLVSARLTTCMSVAILDQASKQFCRLHASPSHEGRDCCESRCDRVWEEVQLGALAPQAEQMEVKRIVDARHLYGLPGVVGNLRRHISTRSADVS